MSVHEQIRRLLLGGFITVFVLVAGMGGWAAVTEISGAVIASGTLVVDNHVKEIQHPTGGIVSEIHVKNGDRVKADDILVRLDATVSKANLSIVARGIDELTARKARLLAERDGASTVEFPLELTARADNPDVADVMTNEQRLFELRRIARNGQKNQLGKRIEQLRREAQGYEAQIEAKTRELALIERELSGARELWEKRLVTISRMTEMERGATRIEGERGHLMAMLAQSEGKLAEVELQILQIELELKSEVGRELREFEARFAELIERKVTAEDRLRRVDIRAPLGGVVNHSIVHTVGGVVSPAAALMQIVPDADSLIVETKVAPQDIDQIYPRQEVSVRFSAFDSRSTPDLFGAVSHIAADATIDPATREAYYVVRVAIAPGELARLGEAKLIPGMPVETFIRTVDRTVLAYLVKPLSDQITRAFREQ